MRGRLAKRRNRRDDIGPAAFESAVRAFAIADPPPVEAKHRMARCRHALRQHRHPAMRAAANLVAARHDQQPVAAGRIVERRGERGALAIEIQLMPHVLLHAAMSAAIAAAIAASSPGSARSEEPTSELQSLLRNSYA